MKNFFKGIIFLIILFLLIEALAYAFLPGDNLGKYGIRKVAAYEILGEEDDTIDVIAVGDSLVYSSLSPMEVWNKHGYTIFDCATAAQLLSETYDLLEVSIESQHPKIVLLEANVLFRDPANRKVDKKINQLGKKVKQYIPIFDYHDNWKKYLSYGLKGNWINFYKGYKFITKVKGTPNKPYMSGSKVAREFPKGNLEIFDKIVKLCEDNNIKLVLVAFPTTSTWSSKKHNAIDQLVEKYGFEFLDLNLMDLGINWETDTKDAGNHLNFKGAIKASNYIGSYLESTGMLVDHRDDEKYASWNKAYQRYYKKHKKSLELVMNK